jgi:serine/threonine protein kinase
VRRLGVVHRDIKPENFLLGAPTLLSAPPGSAASVLKVSDFGVSAFLEPGQVRRRAGGGRGGCLAVVSSKAARGGLLRKPCMMVQGCFWWSAA